MTTIAMGILAASVAAGYFTIAAVIAPRIKMPSANPRFVVLVRVAAMAFFVGCGLTHVHILVHTLGLPPGAPQPVESHELIFHVMQAVGAWLFVVGAVLKLELHIVPSQSREEERAVARAKLEQQERVSASFARQAAREAALARISGQALADADPSKLLIEAADIVRQTLDAAGCDVVLPSADAGAAPPHVERTVVPLTDWVSGRAALVVDVARPRRLDEGEQEFLHAVSNVLVGALRRWNIEQEIVRQSLHDPLTDLPNRVLLLDRVEHALSRSRRARSAVSALFIDLDGFKQVNDRLGHNAGDELLKAVAQRLRLITRPQDTLARLSGDEFVVVCDETDGATATAVAERIVADLALPFSLEAGTAVVGASIGVVAAAGSDRTGEQLLHEADAAMYRAKQGGRGRVEVFDDDLRQQLSRRNQMEQELGGAHERGELRLVYQPIVAVQDDRVVGAEALLRWHHPREGLKLPDAFIAVAESRGLIVPIGEWVVSQACTQAARWRALTPDDVPFWVAINLSVHQLAEPAFATRFAELLAATGARASDVVVEVTETAMTEDRHAGVRLAQTLHELRALGVRAALDDFGTGYSSLTHLRTLPLDILKVDASFVAGLGSSGREQAIVSGLAGITQELGVTVLAEGVETPAQLIAVRTLGFDLAQGFHLGRPDDPRDIEQRLLEGANPTLA